MFLVFGSSGRERQKLGVLAKTRWKMKRSHGQEFRKHFDFYRSAKPGISKTLVGRCTVRDLCCGSRLRCNLGDVQARRIRIVLIVNVNCRVFTVLSIYFAGRSFGGHRGQTQIALDYECLASRRRRAAGNFWFAAGSQSVHYSDLYFLNRNWICLQRSRLDGDRAGNSVR